MLRGKVCKFSKSEQRTVLFIGNLPHELNQDQVRQTLQEIVGSSLPIQHVELKTKPPPANESRGFCFVKWSSYLKAYAAKKILSDAKIKGQPMNISWAENRTNATQQVDEVTMSQVKTLYVSDIPTTVSDAVLRSHFIEFGEILNCSIVKNVSGESRGFAFIEYKERAAAEKALSQNGKEIVKGNCLSVQLAKPAPLNQSGSVERNLNSFQAGRGNLRQLGNSNRGNPSGRGKLIGNRGNVGGGRGMNNSNRGNHNDALKRMGNQPKLGNRGGGGKNNNVGQGRGTKRPRFGEASFGGNPLNVPHSPTSYGMQAPPFPYPGISYDYHQSIPNLPPNLPPYSPPIQQPMQMMYSSFPQQQIYPPAFYPYQQRQ
eukprot:TRINITY_DN3547_c0_g1_i1.p1 TRINITY_DN3547_c0_g1~~TRINITY_DN3547_c0_g1_i1.p1  ORF type:complete len:372 (-),score=141.39 TRINITY_DN3547_c0_g1_i1:295-1410(-)